jgi:hypothetical protein
MEDRILDSPHPDYIDKPSFTPAAESASAEIELLIDEDNLVSFAAARTYLLLE